MNKIMFDIMCQLNNNDAWDIKESARKLFKSFSIIESEYIALCNEGYVQDKMLTLKGKAYLEEHKINNAVILAAGVSTRFVPL